MPLQGGLLLLSLRLERILDDLPEPDATYLRAYIGHLEDRGVGPNVLGLGLAAGVSGVVWGLVGFALGRWL